MKQIPFDEEHVKEYLDRCIKHWRSMENAEGKIYYIDAFQSVRMTLFGETLRDDNVCKHGKIVDTSNIAPFSFAGFLTKCKCCGEWIGNNFKYDGGLAEYCNECKEGMLLDGKRIGVSDLQECLG